MSKRERGVNPDVYGGLEVPRSFLEESRVLPVVMGVLAEYAEYSGLGSLMWEDGNIAKILHPKTTFKLEGYIYDITQEEAKIWAVKAVVRRLDSGDGVIWETYIDQLVTAAREAGATKPEDILPLVPGVWAGIRNGLVLGSLDRMMHQQGKGSVLGEQLVKLTHGEVDPEIEIGKIKAQAGVFGAVIRRNRGMKRLADDERVIPMGKNKLYVPYKFLLELYADDKSRQEWFGGGFDLNTFLKLAARAMVTELCEEPLPPASGDARFDRLPRPHELLREFQRRHTKGLGGLASYRVGGSHNERTYFSTLDGKISLYDQILVQNSEIVFKDNGNVRIGTKEVYLDCRVRDVGGMDAMVGYWLWLMQQRERLRLGMSEEFGRQMDIRPKSQDHQTIHNGAEVKL